MENLNVLLGQQCQIEAKLRNVSLLFPRLNTVKSDAKHLSEMIQFTSVLAENVSAKVRELDLAKVFTCLANTVYSLIFIFFFFFFFFPEIESSFRVPAAC